MATLTNTKIKDTYDGLLKTTDNEALDASGVTLIEDGLGNASALSVGRSGNGVSVSGLLDVSGEVQGTSLDINGAADISGNLAVDTNTLYVDAASNEVGINTSSPSYALDINASTAQIQTAGATSLIFRDTGWGNVIIGHGAIGSGQGKFAIGGLSPSFVVDTNNNRVGVGTSSPATLLQLNHSGSLSNAIQVGDIDTIASNTGIYFRTTGNAYISTASTGTHIFDKAGNEKMRIDSSGNVGIGTSSPSSRGLQINKASADSGLVITRTGTGAAEFQQFIDSSGNIRFNNASSTASIFYTANTERMRIDSSGNVGIGTSSPLAKINVDNGHYLRTNSTNTSQENILLQGAGYYIGSSLYGNVSIRSNYDLNTNKADLSFYVGTGGTNTSERMRITSGGDVLIGTTGTPDGTTNYGSGFIAQSNERKQLRLATNTTGSLDLAQFYNLNGKVGSILTSGSATVYNTISDYRLKENVVEMTGALDRVDALKPSRFNFIADPEKTVDGFLAHEVAEVVPEAISGEKDAIDEEGNPIYQGIDQSKIVPLLVGAIKELSAKVAALESQLNA